MTYISEYDHRACEHDDSDAEQAACDIDSLVVELADMGFGNAELAALANRLAAAWNVIGG